MHIFNCVGVRLSPRLFSYRRLLALKINDVLKTLCDAKVFFSSFTPDVVPTSQAM